MIQPLVKFLIWENFVRKIEDRILLDDFNIVIFYRDNNKIAINTSQSIFGTPFLHLFDMLSTNAVILMNKMTDFYIRLNFVLIPT